ncbi:MAG: cupredoxin domain-containing protein [Dehalococcoidia bacterium]
MRVAAYWVLALALVACGGDDDDSGGGAPPAGTPVESITITARSIEFDIDEFIVEAGAEITVTFENEDEGVPHNIAFSELGVRTDVEDGPTTQQLTFTADEPGEYEFVCDAHPPQMRGRVVVR